MPTPAHHEIVDRLRTAGIDGVEALPAHVVQKIDAAISPIQATAAQVSAVRKDLAALTKRIAALSAQMAALQEGIDQLQTTATAQYKATARMPDGYSLTAKVGLIHDDVRRLL